MEEVNILELTERCIKYFQRQCYTRNRITVYKSLWRNGIIRYMSQKDIESYSPSVGAEFVSTCHFHGTIRPQEREKIRSIQVLDDMLKLGYIRKRCFTPVFHALDGEVGAEMEKLITHLTNLRRSMVTIKDYRLYLSEFLMHLNERNVKHVPAITEKDILTFVSSHPTNKVNIVSALRVLFRFWREEHIVDDRFEELFDTYKTHKPERIPSYFTANEVMRIEQSVSRNSANGKRNYAMLLLASRLGLRASDIADLQFSDIDWDKNMITLTMQKTKKVIELPLLADVGNAIIDYLRHGRPKSDSQNVFLSGNAPYVTATKNMVCAAINGIILRSGVDTSGKHHGPHSLRHSLASAMLNGGSMMPVISESLGHRSTQTTLAYLKIDIRSLQKCALPVPEIADCFYMQRGGAFYG
ncbi:site-specific integrase [Prevotella sp. P6B1]|uniref:site-specific integrase n=1 Tax=Prevotella sp. P6B1 TaxID=1410613 RepID=UPI00051B7C5B|nr:site-specific integrase [Prevotella sp. P6B1]